jgi:hypothetical protein
VRVSTWEEGSADADMRAEDGGLRKNGKVVCANGRVTMLFLDEKLFDWRRK